MDTKFLTKDFHGMPTWVWIVAGLGGVGLGYYFYRRSKTSQAAAAANTAAAAATPQVPDIGTPVGPNAGNQTPTGATINIGVPATPSNWLTSLVLESSHPVNEYASAGQPGGLPDAVIGTIPAGSTVQATGPEIVGAWNTPNGSELWYPVTYNGTAGFISAQDVANASTAIGSSPVPPVPVTNSGTIRAKGTSSYDKSHNGVPFWNSPTGTSTEQIPYGTSVVVLKTGVKGTNHSNGGNYTQVSWSGKQGYVASQDMS